LPGAPVDVATPDVSVGDIIDEGDRLVIVCPVQDTVRKATKTAKTTINVANLRIASSRDNLPL
jgi:hypothetical protein